MSNTSTPTRPGRGIVVPGIDTHSDFDPQYHQPQQQAHCFSQWPLTPSRRPSLAYSSLSDASHSGPSSISSFSQPATPVHSMANSAENFAHQWQDATEMYAAVPNHMETTCPLEQTQPVYDVSFSTHGLPMSTQEMAMQLPTASTVRNAAWQHAQHHSFGATMQIGLGDTLYHSSLGLGQEHLAHASMYANPSSSMPTALEQSVFANRDTKTSSSFHPQPQVVVPSQLGPQDAFSMEQYSDYNDQNEDMARHFTQSFDDSQVTGPGGWESVGPQSPMEAYMNPSDEDYVMVKEELPGTPSSRSSAHRSHTHYLPAHSSPHRIQRRNSRKARKSLAAGKVFYEADTGYCHVRCEGKPFTLTSDSHGRVQVHHESSKAKPHKCTDRKPDGSLCNAKFERSEHLKRHASSHSNDRPYPCPLPGCKQRISRPDNAGDHFKTHLRCHSTGKRNRHHSYEELEAAILGSPAYTFPDSKKANKLLANLRKWMAAEAEMGRRSVVEKAAAAAAAASSSS